MSAFSYSAATPPWCAVAAKAEWGLSGLEFFARQAGIGEGSSVLDLNVLVLQMHSGQQRALEQFYDATVGRAYALAVRMLRSREDAEEVVCDAYAQAWANAGKFDPERANAMGWLLMICRSRALDRLRQRRSRLATGTAELQELDDIADPAPRPDELLTLLQDGSRVHKALAALPEDRRRLVGMAFLDGLSHQEIATATGLPLGTVKSHVKRALASLRAALGEDPQS